MDKKTIIGIFAVGLVLLFLIEPFAIGIIQSAGNAGSAQGGAGGNSTLSGFTGTAVANVTIVRYEPYLIVSGNGSGVDAVKDALLSEKAATYAVWSGDSLVVSLKSSKDVPSAARRFEDANASVLATAYISTQQNVVVTNTNGTSASAEGTSISMQVNPVYEEGSTHEATFAARVDGGQITGMGQVSIAPAIVKGVPVEAALSSAPAATYTVSVAWQGRAVAKPLAVSSGATYKERSFVYVANATKEALDIAVAGKPYVTGTQPEIISVQNDYTDGEAIGRDLMAKGYAATFPPSIATFGNASGNASALALVASLSSANISAQISEAWTAKITLPSVLSKDGRQYAGPAAGIELLIEGTGTPRENVTAMNVSVDLEAVGSKITRITAVNPQ